MNGSSARATDVARWPSPGLTVTGLALVRLATAYSGAFACWALLFLTVDGAVLLCALTPLAVTLVATTALRRGARLTGWAVVVGTGLLRLLSGPFYWGLGLPIVPAAVLLGAAASTREPPKVIRLPGPTVRTRPARGGGYADDCDGLCQPG